MKMEKRQYTRIPFWHFVMYRVLRDDQEDKGNYEFGFSKDISLGGMKFRTNERFNTCDRLDMRLYMPGFPNESDSKYIPLTAKVLRVEKKEKKLYDIAVQFLDVLEEDRRIISAFIEVIGSATS